MKYAFEFDPGESKKIIIPLKENEGLDLKMPRFPNYPYAFSFRDSNNIKVTDVVDKGMTVFELFEVFEPQKEDNYTLEIINRNKKKMIINFKYEIYQLEEIEIPFISKIDGKKKLYKIIIGRNKKSKIEAV